jgi:hypothetical protein
LRYCRDLYGEPCDDVRSDPKKHADVFFRTYYETLKVASSSTVASDIFGPPQPQ